MQLIRHQNAHVDVLNINIYTLIKNKKNYTNKLPHCNLKKFEIFVAMYY